MQRRHAVSGSRRSITGFLSPRVWLDAGGFIGDAHALLGSGERPGPGSGRRARSGTSAPPLECDALLSGIEIEPALAQESDERHPLLLRELDGE
jgi:hypothetical protein